MKIKVYILIFLILILVSYFITSRSNDFYKRGNAFLENSEKFQRKNNLILSGYGINLNDTIETPKRNSIHQFYINFFSKEQLDLNTARKKLIKCIGNFLVEINNNIRIRNYIYEYPFDHRDLHFGISFYDNFNKRVQDKYISSCVLDKNKIYYEIAHSDGSFSQIHEETYEEALKIVENEKSNK